jgi:hypothetical protein
MVLLWLAYQANSFSVQFLLPSLRAIVHLSRESWQLAPKTRSLDISLLTYADRLDLIMFSSRRTTLAYFNFAGILESGAVGVDKWLYSA